MKNDSAPVSAVVFLISALALAFGHAATADEKWAAARTADKKQEASAALASLGKLARTQNVRMEVATLVDGTEDKLDGWFRIFHTRGTVRVDDASQTATVFHSGRILKWDLDGPDQGKARTFSKAGGKGATKVKDWNSFLLQNRMETLFITDAFYGYETVLANSGAVLLEKTGVEMRFQLTLGKLWKDIPLVGKIYPEGMKIILVVDPKSGIPTSMNLNLQGREIVLSVTKTIVLKDSNKFQAPRKN